MKYLLICVTFLLADTAPLHAWGRNRNPEQIVMPSREHQRIQSLIKAGYDVTQDGIPPSHYSDTSSDRSSTGSASEGSGPSNLKPIVQKPTEAPPTPGRLARLLGRKKKNESETVQKHALKRIKKNKRTYPKDTKDKLCELIRENRIEQPLRINSAEVMISNYLRNSEDSAPENDLILLSKQLPSYHNQLCLAEVEGVSVLLRACQSGDAAMIYYMLSQDSTVVTDYSTCEDALQGHIQAAKRSEEVTAELRNALKALQRRQREHTCQTHHFSDSTNQQQIPLEQELRTKVRALDPKQELERACAQGTLENIDAIIERTNDISHLKSGAEYLILHTMTNADSRSDEETQRLRETLQKIISRMRDLPITHADPAEEKKQAFDNQNK